MEHIYHYTSEKRWKKIMETKYLIPYSTGESDILTMPGNLYTVGLQKPSCNGWWEWDLMKDLMEHTTGEILLEVPIFQNCLEEGFVREHALYSPKRFKNEHGVHLSLFEIIYVVDHSILAEAWNEYINSTIPLSKYKGNYLAPEIWLPQKTPIEKLTRIK